MPKGAMLFNASGIAMTLFIIFMSILPALYVIHGDKTKQTTHQDTPTTQSTQDFILPNEVEEIDDNIFKICQGESVGTLIHQEA